MSISKLIDRLGNIALQSQKRIEKAKGNNKFLSPEIIENLENIRYQILREKERKKEKNLFITYR